MLARVYLKSRGTLLLNLSLSYIVLISSQDICFWQSFETTKLKRYTCVPTNVLSIYKKTIIIKLSLKPLFLPVSL